MTYYKDLTGTLLSYPLVAIGTSPFSGYFYSILDAPVGCSINNNVTLLHPQQTLEIDPTIFPMGQTILSINVQDTTTSAETQFTMTVNNTYPSIPATSIKEGELCVIEFPGTTNFMLIGAPSNDPGAMFYASADGTALIGGGTVVIYKICNEDTSLIVDASNPANLLATKTVAVVSTIAPELNPTYRLDPDIESSPQISISTTGTLTFIPYQYGDYYASVQVTTDSSWDLRASKTIKFSVIPAYLWKMSDGKIEIEYTGDNSITPGKYSLTCEVEDSSAIAKTFATDFSVAVNSSSVYGIQVPTDSLRYWTNEDTAATPGAIKLLPTSGNLPNTLPVFPGVSRTFANGLIASVSNGGIQIYPPSALSSYTPRTAKLVVPIQLTNYGTISTTVNSMVINTSDPSLDNTTALTPFELDVYLNTARMNQDFILLSPLKPYLNAPDITKKVGLVSRVKSGQTLPMGLSLDSISGLVYGIPQEAANNYTTIEYVESEDVVGWVNVHFDIVSCSMLMTDQKEVPSYARTLVAGTAPESALVFNANTVKRTDMSWTEEGAKPTALSLSVGGLPTTLTFSGFGLSTPFISQVINVADIYDADNKFVSSTLSIPNTQTFPSIMSGSGTVTTQTFLRSAIETANPIASIAIYNGYLPTGLELQYANKRAVITGSPTEFGIFDTTLVITDITGNESHWVLSQEKGTGLEVPFNIPLQITTTSNQLPILNSTNAQTFQLQAIGGSGSYTWSLVNSVLPAPGMTFSSAGVIYCPAGISISTPTSTQLTFAILDSNSNIGEAVTLTMTYSNILRITTTSIPPFNLVTSPQTFQFTAIGGTPFGSPPVTGDYNWAITGLSAEFSYDSATGILTYIPGVPPTAVTLPIGVTVTDNGAPPASAYVLLNVVTAPTVLDTGLILTPSFGDNKTYRGWPYSASVSVSRTSGYTGPYLWSIANLPSGLVATQSSDSARLDITGICIGEIGDVTLIITVLDSGNKFNTLYQNLSVKNGLTFVTSALPQIKKNVAYQYTGDPNYPSGHLVGIKVSAPNDYYVFPSTDPSYTSGPINQASLQAAFGANLTMESNGVISGTWQGIVAKADSIVILASNGLDTIYKSFPLSAVLTGPIINSPAIPLEPVGQAWAYQLVASGGSGALTWEPTTLYYPFDTPSSFPLPSTSTSSVSLSSNGLLTAPANLGLYGSFPISVQVTDSAPIPATTYAGYTLALGAAEVIQPGPQYTGGSSSIYVGYVNAINPGNPLKLTSVTLDSLDNFVSASTSSVLASFQLILTEAISGNVTAVNAVTNISDPSYTIGLTCKNNGLENGKYLPVNIYLNNLPVNTVGDHSFNITVTDGPNVSFTVPVTYKSVSQKTIGVTQHSTIAIPSSIVPIMEKDITNTSISSSLIVTGATMETYSGSTLTPLQVLNMKALQITPGTNTKPFSLQAISSTSDSYGLLYDGSTWSSGTLDFNLEVLYSDIAYYNSVLHQADLFTPVRLSTDISTNIYSGGAGVILQIQPLVYATIGSHSGATFPGDSYDYTITLNLAKPLHSTQNPTVSISSVSGVTFGAAVPGKDTYGRIIKWTFTASAVAPTSGTVTVTLSETIPYLHNGLIQSNFIPYTPNYSFPLTVTVGSPATWSINSLTVAPYGVRGQLEPGFIGQYATYVGYAGWIKFTGVIQSSLASAFNSSAVQLVAIPFNGSTASPVFIGSMICDTSKSSSSVSNGATYYYQTYYLYVNTLGTSVAEIFLNSSLAANPGVQFGVMALNTAGSAASKTYSTSQYLNRNFNSNPPTSWVISTTYQSKGVWFTYKNTGFNTTPTGWAVTGGVAAGTTTNIGLLSLNGSIAIQDMWGQEVVANSVLENVNSVKMYKYVTSTGVSTLLTTTWSRSSTPTNGLFPLLVNVGTNKGIIQVYFVLTTTSGQTFSTPKLTVNIKANTLK